MSGLIEYCHVLPIDDEWIGKSTKQSQTLPENSGLLREHADERGARKYHTKTAEGLGMAEIANLSLGIFTP